MLNAVGPATFAWLFPLAFLFVGVMFIRSSVRGRRSRRAFEQNATRTSGEVIDLRWESHTHASDHKRLAYSVLNWALIGVGCFLILFSLAAAGASTGSRSPRCSSG